MNWHDDSEDDATLVGDGGDDYDGVMDEPVGDVGNGDGVAVDCGVVDDGEGIR